MQLYFAPLEGVTGYAFRRAHMRYFAPADKYFAPFYSPTREHVLPPRAARELDPVRNEGVPLVPQLLCRDPGDFIWAAKLLADMGYGEVNLNLGCPSGTVAAKGKGSGFLAFPEELEAFFERVFAEPGMPRVSVKTRLGVEDPAEFAVLLDIYRRFPISELIVHPRVRRDMYKLPAKPEHFPENGPWPLCYNGDIFTAAAARELETRFPGVSALMLGRGAAANPALFSLIRGGDGVERGALRAFHDEIYDTCCRDFGSAGSAMLRMKELWSYLRCLFPDSDKALKRLAKTRRPEEFAAVAADILGSERLEPAGAFNAFQCVNI